MIGHFEGELDVRVTQEPDGRRPVCFTLAPFAYTTPSGTRWEVPAGTRTDFASVPWFLWWLFPSFDTAAKAAVLHDYLWRRGRGLGLGEALVDRTYREALRALGVSQWRRNALWLGVRLNRNWKILRGLPR